MIHDGSPYVPRYRIDNVPIEVSTRATSSDLTEYSGNLSFPGFDLEYSMVLPETMREFVKHSRVDSALLHLSNYYLSSLPVDPNIERFEASMKRVIVRQASLRVNYMDEERDWDTTFVTPCNFALSAEAFQGLRAIHSAIREAIPPKDPEALERALDELGEFWKRHMTGETS